MSLTQDHQTKKLMNAPEEIIPEMIEGMVLSHPDLLKLEGKTGRAVVAVDGPRDGKVGIVVGGGSGHEPAFAGYVGRGLADAAAVGNVFASPSPEHIKEAAMAADGGAGVVLLYGNYTGDVLNFDMAAEECAELGMDVRSVAVIDDVASAPKEKAGERRGIAGDFFVFKVAGAAADQGRSLEEVYAAANHANASTLSMGVALSACSMPQTLKPNFDIGPDEMEIGMGLHGEPGMRRGKVDTADHVTETLMDMILGEMAPEAGDEVAVLVNGLGATSPMELYLVFRRVAQILGAKGVKIYHSWVGEYCTSMEMAGASVTLMKLDEDLKSLLDHPCRTVALTVGSAPVPVAGATHTARNYEAASRADAIDRASLKADGSITPENFRAMMQAAGNAIATEKDRLSELDGVIGDGDHGVTMDIGWTAVMKALEGASDQDTISQTCTKSAKAFLDAVGASSGPLYASAFNTAGKAVSNRLNLDASAMASWVEGMLNGILNRGGASAGDKTMIDAWMPAAQEARKAAGTTDDPAIVLKAACRGARMGADATREMESRRGRSKKLGNRSVGHIDPGAESAYVTLKAMSEALDSAG
ncbi:homodimeric dihydroxyacetone kinase [Cohaesibacter sp. ES.047]|uniref:dihydroxyacetone kinase subunit DhaL n=1 Tax=Cohaesibacter sp. ES.047 TaxID=1798205 RepID=UPI000BB7E90F|nr:dihydroxyacetone kinase subunit DhaL [Cohaesibacter sp. ES.047]SNY91215.1 homodimeric dihydroxyacetone kinase [Cohaesibacter sp. ES.047]SNY93952.1 homodimeric dihydroxyacetone kinase [Cohaesibacter sp. ES.047]